MPREKDMDKTGTGTAVHGREHGSPTATAARRCDSTEPAGAQAAFGQCSQCDSCTTKSPTIPVGPFPLGTLWDSANASAAR